jgi:hypothetical protein
VVVPDHAAVVVRIFEWYAAGIGLRTIAHNLNAHRTPPPRPRKNKERPASWSPTAVREMLRNRVYEGVMIFGRSVWKKHPDTGKRQRIEQPVSAWIERREERLRIISPELWEAVQIRLREHGGHEVRRSSKRKHAVTTSNKTRRKHLVSGLLSCAACGGPYYDLAGRGMLGCGTRQARGRESPLGCASDLKVQADGAADLVLRGVSRALQGPEVADDLVADVTTRVLAALRQPTAGARKRLAEINRGIPRLLDLVLEEPLPELSEKLSELQREREALQVEIAAAAGAALTRTEIEGKVRARLGSMAEALAHPGSREAAQALLDEVFAGGLKLRVVADPTEALGYRIEGSTAPLRLVNAGSEWSAR